MAIVHVKTGITGVEFGVGVDEGSLITKKVTVSRKIKKKDLRGRQGDFKSIASYSKTVEATIEGALAGPSPGTTGFTLAAAHELTATNDDFALGTTLYVESITLNEKNEDFKQATIKLVGNENFD